ncbi:MAG: M24 family metallopeptidase [Alphaproteobacteria bacterium]|nr:M24 family metallopeptidase [Alphaproteobacteria bacterium]
MTDALTDDLTDILTIENGAPATPTFSAAEMARRRDAVRGVMADRGIDAAFFTSIHMIAYLSDFVYCSFGRSYGLALTPEAATVIAANIDGGQPGRRARASGAGALTYTDWRRENFEAAATRLLPARGRVGVEFDHLPIDRRARLQAALPEVEFVDVAADCMALRLVKSAEEIAHIKAGAAIADLGGAACVAAIGEGVPEHEVALASTGAMVRAIAERFPTVELMDSWTWFQSGLNTDGAHNPVTSRRVRAGDILSLNCFPMIAGYYTALERTLFFDHCDDASLNLWAVNVAVHERGLSLIRPGARCCDIAAELNEIYRAHGLLGRRTFGYGHSFGVLSHYYGREAGLELREDVETVLAPGMVVSMEPMIMIPEGEPGAGGYREHDILVVTEDGAENITGFPYGPAHNIVR